MATRIFKKFYILMHDDDAFVDIFMSEHEMIEMLDARHSDIILKHYPYSQSFYNLTDGVHLYRYQIRKFNIALTASVSIN